MYKLLYSEKADDRIGHNIALNTNGERVKYTCMVDENISGHWKSNYLLDDAQEVGILDRIVEYNKIKNFEYIETNETDRYRYWR